MIGSSVDWIACDIKPPPENVPVLVYSHDGRQMVAEWSSESSIGPWWDAIGIVGADREIDWDLGDYHPWRGVTHWAPLPEPPRPPLKAADAPRPVAKLYGPPAVFVSDGSYGVLTVGAALSEAKKQKP